MEKGDCPSWLEVKNTPTASLLKDKTLQMSVMHMTQNNLMVSWLVGWFFGLCHINLCRLSNRKSIFPFQHIQISQTVLVQPIQFSISIELVYTVKCQKSSILNNSVEHMYSFNIKTVLF